jgi:hypothetical protein
MLTLDAQESLSCGGVVGHQIVVGEREIVSALALFMFSGSAKDLEGLRPCQVILSCNFPDLLTIKQLIDEVCLSLSGRACGRASV